MTQAENPPSLHVYRPLDIHKTAPLVGNTALGLFMSRHRDEAGKYMNGSFRRSMGFVGARRIVFTVLSPDEVTAFHRAADLPLGEDEVAALDDYLYDKTPDCVTEDLVCTRSLSVNLNRQARRTELSIVSPEVIRQERRLARTCMADMYGMAAQSDELWDDIENTEGVTLLHTPHRRAPEVLGGVAAALGRRYDLLPRYLVFGAWEAERFASKPSAGDTGGTAGCG